MRTMRFLAATVLMAASVAVMGGGVVATSPVSELRLDPAFSTSGVVDLGFPSAVSAGNTSLLVRPDGHILVNGGVMTSDVAVACLGDQGTSTGWIEIAALLPNGAVDTAFGPGGRVRLCVYPLYSGLTDWIARADNSVVVDINSAAQYGRVVTLSANGSPTATTGWFYGKPYVYAGLTGHTLLSDGRILLYGGGRLAVLGGGDQNLGPFGTDTMLDLRPLAFEPVDAITLSNGNLVLFGKYTTSQASGVLVVSPTGVLLPLPASIRALSFGATTTRAFVVSGGRYLLAGDDPSGWTTTYRLIDADGRIVSTFGTNGRLVVSGGDPATRATVSGDGSLTTLSTLNSGEQLLRRVRADGIPDRSLGADGAVVLPGAVHPSGAEFVRHVEAMSDGRLAMLVVPDDTTNTIRIRVLSSGATPIASGESRRVQVAGVGGVPVGVSSVLLNVVEDGAVSAGFLSVRSCGVSGFPETSTVNFAGGVTVANSAVVRLDGDGAVCVYSSVRADVIVDVSGWQTPGESALTTQDPQRIADTRQVGAGGVVGAGESRRVQVAGVGGVPVGVSSVLLNVVEDGAVSAGFLSVRSCGVSGFPETSTVNFAGGVTVANSAVVRLDGDGAVCVYSSVRADVIVDVSGWQTPGESALTTQDPQRIIDTRTG